jgi:hypothetical protein
MAELSQVLRGVGKLLEGAADRRQELAPGLGQAQGPARPVEQGLSDPFLQRLDLMADRGMGDVQLLRRLRNSERPSGAEKRPSSGTYLWVASCELT